MRRQVEQEWHSLREVLENIRRQCYPELVPLSCLLFFRTLLVPSTADHRPFAHELWGLVQDHVPEKAGERLDVWLMDLDPPPPLLSRHLSHVSLARYKEYGPTGWNHDVAGVGLVEDVLLAAVQPKLRLSRLPNSDEFWLLVHGGDGISAWLHLPHANQLHNFHRLTAALEQGPYDKVSLYMPGWERIVEWSKNDGGSLSQFRLIVVSCLHPFSSNGL